MQEQRTQPTPAEKDADREAEERALSAEADAAHPPVLPGMALFYRQPGRHERTGVTKNKSQGQSKRRRRMAKVSRRQNRGK